MPYVTTLTAADVEAGRYREFDPEWHNFYWQDDGTVIIYRLDWNDDASYLAYQSDYGTPDHGDDEPPF